MQKLQKGGPPAQGESGLDEFGARYYTNTLGRFMIPDWAAKPTDVPYANFGNPQSLNLYSYVENNPTTLGDPDGHDIWDTIRGALVATANDVLGTPRPEGGNSDYKAGEAIGDGAIAAAGAYDTVQTAAGSIAFDVGTGGVGTLTVTAQAALVAVPAVITTRAAGNLVSDVKQMSGRVGDFTSGEKKQLDKDNASKNGGQNKCTECGQDVQKVQNQKGQSTPGNQLQRHHDPMLSKGGSSQSPRNRIVCKGCHVKIHKKKP